MSDKYLIHGATYCGDGTTSSEAASNGAAGAWNNINIMTASAPAYGTLAAGDIVHVRSKTGNGANANIAVTISAAFNFGSGNATSGSWIKWVIDGGTVWSGINGTITFSFTYDSVATSNFYNYNEFSCDTKDALALVWTNVYLASTASFNTTKWIRAKIQQAGGGYYSNPAFCIANTIYIDCHIVYNQTSFLFWTRDGNTLAQFINPDIELLGSGGYIFVIACAYSNGSARVQVTGGQVRGSGAAAGCTLSTMGTGAFGFEFQAIGLQYPTTVTIGDTNGYCKASTYGMDGGYGAELSEPWGHMNSRQDGYYPTLNATYPNVASTPWSWKIYPNQASRANPMHIKIAKEFTDSAAAKTITAEFLLATTITAANKRTLQLHVMYTDDSTGLSKIISSTDDAAGALTTSTAGWSSNTYGAINFNKRNISVTTPTTIKQNTPVICEIVGEFGTAGGNDILFLDPDVQFS